MGKADDPESQKRKEEIKKADVRLLAQLGYKQEFKRDFKPLEVSGPSQLEMRLRSIEAYMVFVVAFVLGLRSCFLNHRLDSLNSICAVLFYSQWRGPCNGLGCELPNL